MAHGMVATVGIAAALLAAGFLLRWPAALDLWPVPITPLTSTFLAAYVFGSAAALGWIAATRELRALAPFGLTVGTASAAMAPVLLTMDFAGMTVVRAAGASVVLAIGGVATLLVALRRPARDARRTPTWLRVTCAVVTGLLLVHAVPLLMRIPDVLPWSVDVDSGALIGCLFAGSAAYFAWGALRPSWPYAAGPLLALLVYDLVLVLPLVAHLPVARPEHITVLVAYIAVLVTTAPLCATGLVLRHAGTARRARRLLR